ncbi:phosphate ABC transporter permease PstA [Nonomuraea sp. SBT364]|uniref:phosphate ABC transporter permease PstA n=1 Tax=Nonomuraea sp. SBT364 TaxID=1580530 RepID=UPI00066DF054|nr:phosphate ABC transporter permease PstA [Nonomuraea sp. SBT364]
MTTIQHISTGRRVKDRMVQGLVYLAFALAVVPLVSVLWLVISNGLARFDMEFLTHSMRNIGARDAGGGAYHAIIGTLEQVLLASVISVPIGLLTAIYLVEYGNGGRLSRAISFFVDVMTGIPSVVAGLFVLAFWILFLGMPYSGFAGAMALSILMMPTVVRSAEEMLRLVPADLREASYALGVPKWRTIVKVVLPTALTGIITGVMLAVARVAGETAPLLLTVFFTDSINNDPFNGPQMGLPLFVFDQAARPNDTAIDRAWTGALTLILIVMLFNLVARLIAWWRSPARGR